MLHKLDAPSRGWDRDRGSSILVEGSSTSTRPLVSSLHAILPRLEVGRPIILSGDPALSLMEMGLPVDGPAALGRLPRDQPDVVVEHYDMEVASRVDVLCALTADTTPHTLGQIGMAFRAAAVTRTAVELAHDATQRAGRAVAVAGLIGSRQPRSIALDRLMEESVTHAARLAAAGCEVLIVRGFSSATLIRRTRAAAVVGATATRLSTWAVVEVDASIARRDGKPIEACVTEAINSGAEAVLLDVADADMGLRAIERATNAFDEGRIGLVLAAPAPAPAATRREDSAEAWAREAKRLVDAGARVIGGGAGTTPHHTTALAQLLGRASQSSMWPRAAG